MADDQVLDTVVQELSNEHGSRCRVVANSGDFSYILTFRLCRRVAMKVQLPDEFPKEAPVVIGDDSRISVARKRWEVSNYSLGVLQQIVRELFGDFQGESAAENSGDEKHVSKDTNQHKRKTKGKSAEPENDEAQKKPRMRVVEDVVKRICWEEGVDRNQVFVGYEDRFKGVLEKRFDDFGFNIDVSDSDERVPLHRIVYFRYAHRVIWDKRTRLDLVFGSTCKPGQCRVTLTDVVREMPLGEQAGNVAGANQDAEYNNDGGYE